MKRNLTPNVFFKCETCGKDVAKYVEPFKQRGGEYTQQYCNRTCAGIGRRGKPRGTGRIVTRGYVLVYSPDHPDVKNKKRKYVLEHRLVMENKLGRTLKPGEVIHHKNENTKDNRIQNLQLFANNAEHKKHHEQQRNRNKRSGRYVKR